VDAIFRLAGIVADFVVSSFVRSPRTAFLIRSSNDCRGDSIKVDAMDKCTPLALFDRLHKVGGAKAEHDDDDDIDMNAAMMRNILVMVFRKVRGAIFLEMCSFESRPKFFELESRFCLPVDANCMIYLEWSYHMQQRRVMRLNHV
jgi:hypothetical protein